MTEIQTTDGTNGDLHQQEQVNGGSSDDEECVRACADADADPSSLNRCQNIDDDLMRSQSPGERRRSSIGEVGTPGGKRGPPRAWPPTEPANHGTVKIPSKPLVRRGSLKGKVWPPPGYNKSQGDNSSPGLDGKGRKGPPRQWPPPKSVSPIQDEITDDQSGEPQREGDRIQVIEELSGDPEDLNNSQYREDDEDINTELLSESYPESPLASRGTPFTMSPSPPATPEPRSDPSPSPRDSPKDNSPRSASPVSQDENDRS